jgi:type VI secretion system protein
MRLTFLERIRQALAGGGKETRREDFINSLERSLSLILNTHQGSSKSAPDFGMPDFISLLGKGDADSLRELSRILTEVIRKYEPRLSGATVSYVPGKESGGVLEFSLTASFTFNNRKESVFFQTSVIPDGSIIVRK